MADQPEYQSFYDSFDITLLTEELQGDLLAGINVCVECCDRHVGHNRVALEWINEGGERSTYTFEDLQALSAQVANLLTAHGVKPGDRVSGLLPRTTDLVALILGVLRVGAVYQPLFTAFGPKAIEHRLMTSQAKLVVTDLTNRAKLDGLPEQITIMCVDGQNGDVDFTSGVRGQSNEYQPVMRSGFDPFLMMATSGTTGPPKCLKIPIRGLAGIAGYMKYGLDLQEDDVFWNIADPGWAYGLYYAVIGPLLLGHQTTFYEGPFSVDSTVSVVQELGVTNFAGAPTAYRMIIAQGTDAAKPLSQNLRVASSAGEPLNPEVMRWFGQHVGCNLFDQYGQTECGMVLANHHGLHHDVREGAAGYAMPGFRLAVVDERGEQQSQGVQGILGVHVEDSLLFFFDGYLDAGSNEWTNGFYLTGDTVEQNADGTISFVGRNDDVISSSGYRIGPFDVESCLIEDDTVAESAVVGIPDERRGEIVKAFVVLHPGFEGSDMLVEKLQSHVRERLGKHAFPRIIDFVGSLPKTPSGKIQRFLLRKQ